MTFDIPTSFCACHVSRCVPGRRPQHHTCPSRSFTQVVSCDALTATARQGNPSVVRGVAEDGTAAVSAPNCPKRFCPKHFTEPIVNTAHVWFVPMDTSTTCTSTSPGSISGCRAANTGPAAPVPNCPLAFCPQHCNIAFTETTQKLLNPPVIFTALLMKGKVTGPRML